MKIDIVMPFLETMLSLNLISFIKMFSIFWHCDFLSNMTIVLTRENTVKTLLVLLPLEKDSPSRVPLEVQRPFYCGSEQPRIET